MSQDLINKLQGKVPANVLSELPLVFSRFRIDTPLRLAHFLAQCDHESGGFTRTVENLNYSSERLLQIFPRYFKTLNEAQSFNRQPQKIANRVYANRMSNGGVNSNDGWNYRGRGYIQLTGRANYSAFDAFVEDRIIENPDLVATKFPLLSAAWFWHANKLNAIADRGDTRDVVTQVRRRVNGGTIGLDDTVTKFSKYYKILTA